MWRFHWLHRFVYWPLICVVLTSHLSTVTLIDQNLGIFKWRCVLGMFQYVQGRDIFVWHPCNAFIYYDSVCICYLSTCEALKLYNCPPSCVGNLWTLCHIYWLYVTYTVEYIYICVVFLFNDVCTSFKASIICVICVDMCLHMFHVLFSFEFYSCSVLQVFSVGE